MTYGRFLLLFLILPIAFSLWVLRREFRNLPWRSLVVLLLIVYAATTPWDNTAVARGLWDFDNAKTWGVRFGHLPLEEMAFFGLQTLLTALWVRHRFGRLNREAVAR